MSLVRRWFKVFVEQMARGSGVTRLSRRRRRSGALILAYHNIIPDAELARGDQSLHLPQARFRQQLELLRRTHEVVPLSRIREPGGASPRPRAAITFDDACQGTMTAGVSELHRLGLPATVFVPTSFVGGHSFWWDSLAQPAGLVDEALREFALSSLDGRDAAVRAWAAQNGVPSQEPAWHQKAATLDQLRAAESRGITFGSHTRGHPNLVAIDGTEVRDEMELSMTWLREHLTAVIPWIAYPYGLASNSVAAAAASAGYEGGLMVSGGWLRADGFAMLMPRVNIPAGLSLAGFEMRISGLLD